MAKILHISKYYYPYFGGIEDAAQTIVRELKPSHHQHVICFNDKPQTVEDEVEGVKVTRVGTIARLFSQPIPVGFQKHLNRILKEFKPDYIHLHLPNPIVSMAVLRAELGNTKLYIHWHADIYAQINIYKFYKRYEKEALIRADKIIATSDIYLNYSKPLQSFKYKSAIVPNTLNDQKFVPQAGDSEKIEAIRKKFGGRKILFFIGRHVPYKGLKYLIESEKYIKEDCVIVIAGDGELTKQLKAQAKGRERIKFIGRISEEELRLYLKAAYLFVFPSVNRGEAFGIALAEALYCGLPAVSFNIEGSGVNWVNKDGYSGLVVENRNTKKFANAVDKLLADKSLRDEFSSNAHKWISDNFLKEKAFKVLHEIYTEKSFPQDCRDVNVSIVLYNNEFPMVKELVEELRGSSFIKEIFLIDNSKNANASYQTLDGTYIYNGRNIGYGRGHNIAFRQTLLEKQATSHIVMNADIVIEPSIIGKIIEFMRQNPDVGMLMPKVYYPNKNIQYLCRLLPSPIDLFGRRFLPKKLIKERIERLEMRHFDYNHIINVPHISGCFMFIRSEILEKSGLFDERYFLYMEDIDLTRRIAKYSQTIFYPEVSIIHTHNRGSYNSLKLLARHIASAGRYFAKWGLWRDKEREEINEKTLEQIKQKN